MARLTASTSLLAAGLPCPCLPAPRVLNRARQSLRVAAASNPVEKTSKVSGVVFEPFNEVKGELSLVSKTDTVTQSFARMDYDRECEVAVNEQINIEYNVSYVYHALFAYFDRDNVALPGLAEYFRHASNEEREHAQMLMRFQNVRGGRVKLQSILMPEMEFNHAEKGDALYAMELALSLEKLNFQKLRQLHEVATKNNDAHMSDFIEGELLQEQAKAVKEVSEYVSQLRRVGKGHGVFHFDLKLQERFGADAVA